MRRGERRLIEKITQENYSAQVEHSGKPVVLCFYAPWCEQCQLMLPELEKTAAEKEEFYKFCLVDIDFETNLAKDFKVENVPSVFLVMGKERREANLEEILD